MIFPLPFRPTEGYKDPPRCFGCPRKNGRRKHAGADLYAPVGTPVLAVDAGQVVRGPYLFYAGSFALEVKHQNGTITRYCELAGSAGHIYPGVMVAPGQAVGYVGGLQGLDISMLHFELYVGTEEGMLTNVMNEPYMRRADLMDPTVFLDECALKGSDGPI
jgi:murein DD-endopeptidase MepM/ murein hydrolase activator NlpD